MYKLINILSPNNKVVFVGSYNECKDLKEKKGLGYHIVLDYSE